MTNYNNEANNNSNNTIHYNYNQIFFLTKESFKVLLYIFLLTYVL